MTRTRNQTYSFNRYVNLAGENPTERAALGIAGLSGAISSFVTTPAELLMIAQQRSVPSLGGCGVDSNKPVGPSGTQ